MRGFARSGKKRRIWRVLDKRRKTMDIGTGTPADVVIVGESTKSKEPPEPAKPIKKRIKLQPRISQMKTNDQHGEYTMHMEEAARLEKLMLRWVNAMKHADGVGDRDKALVNSINSNKRRTKELIKAAKVLKTGTTAIIMQSYKEAANDSHNRWVSNLEADD